MGDNIENNIIADDTSTEHNKDEQMQNNSDSPKKEKKSLWEVVVRIAIAALSAALTAITTTSCIGHGPF